MKILFIITGLGLGGAERIVSELADNFSRKGHTVKIAYLTGEAIVRPHDRSIEILPLDLHSFNDLPRALLKLRTLISSYRPDIVHSHMFHANILARLVRLTSKIPKLICTAHSSNEGGRMRMTLYRLTDKLATISTNVSQEAVDALVGKRAAHRNRMISIPNGIDVDKFRFSESHRFTIREEFNIPHNTKVLLSVGRFAKEKDYPNLIASLSYLKQSKHDFVAFIVGDGPLRENIETLVFEHQLETNVFLLGQRNDIPQLMSASDIFVLSSKYEGLPLVVAEAMSCERIVVATDCGGVAEVLGDCGFLAQPSSPQSLKAQIDRAMELSIEQSRAMGRQARLRVISNFSIDTCAEKYLELYSE